MASLGTSRIFTVICRYFRMLFCSPLVLKMQKHLWPATCVHNRQRDAISCMFTSSWDFGGTVSTIVTWSRPPADSPAN